MALFKKDYNKPGPGVPKNAPKKKGISRYFEVFMRDFSDLVKLNLWYVLCCLPSLIFFGLAMLSFSAKVLLLFLIFGLLALAFGPLVGAGKTAMYGLLTRKLRDEPSFIGHDFRRLFKENLKSGALAGIVYCLLVGSQVIALVYYLEFSSEISMPMLALYLFSLLIFHMVAPYYFLQAAYIDLNSFGILKNSLLFALGYLPRTLAGMAISAVVNVAQILLVFIFPPAIVIPIFIGITAPALAVMMWYWPHVDKTFNIDKTLSRRTSDTMDERMVEIGETGKVVNKDVLEKPEEDAQQEEATQEGPENEPTPVPVGENVPKADEAAPASGKE